MFLTSHIYPSAPAPGFGTEPRGGRRSRHASPGPGAYEVQAMSGVGSQALSTRLSPPFVSAVVGRAARREARETRRSECARNGRDAGQLAHTTSPRDARDALVAQHTPDAPPIPPRA